MPWVWMHATFDLVVYGRTHFDMHKKKDAPYKELGVRHREINHEWYKLFGKEWTLDNPFPKTIVEFFEVLEKSKLGDDEVEQHQAWAGHDYFDRVWNTLTNRERRYWEGAYYWLLNHPEILKTSAEIDVINGKIHRVINGKEIWEEEPAVVQEYRRLKAYADKWFAGQPPEFHELYRQYSSP